MLNVLIIEDDPVIAMDIKSIVDEMDGVVGYIVSDMPSALKLADKCSMHLVVSDIQIKGSADGIEAAKMLQRLYLTPVLFLTSYHDEATLVRAAQVDFSGYLLKPFNEDELIAGVKLCALKIKTLNSSIEIGSGYRYDSKIQQLFCDDEPITLTTKEHQLFLLLLNSRGQVVPFAHIDDVVWCNQSINDTSRRQLFHRLRTKVDKLSFESVKYGGYILKN
ncbi:MAG: response regulator [Sulfurimonas sp.]|uniref:response regulator n=1 Tax=Sulfurimonas sp. TaxID=2022749 RepID=UPI00260D5519|nr:response regulator [Sulfurimonas sp.]MDD2651484.1 response regulator [Sulfurimonas sp.]MDD3451025.1 response regulator [Sulfurimonas sp.]